MEMDCDYGMIGHPQALEDPCAVLFERLGNLLRIVDRSAAIGDDEVPGSDLLDGPAAPAPAVRVSGREDRGHDPRHRRKAPDTTTAAGRFVDDGLRHEGADRLTPWSTLPGGPGERGVAEVETPPSQTVKIPQGLDDLVPTGGA